MKQLRKSKKLSQASVARQIDISYPAYRRYELGEREMPISTVVKLANLYEVSLDYLVGRRDEE